MNEGKYSITRPSSTRGSRRNPPRARRRRTPRRRACFNKRKRFLPSGRLEKDLECRRIRRAFRTLKKHVFKLFTREEVEELARESFYRRTPREIPAFEFAISCALSSLVETKRGFASVWRMLSAAAGITVG